MHEASLIRDLVAKIEQVAADQNATKVTRIHVRLGALSHCSPEHFQEHYDAEAKGGIAQHAKLEFEIGEDPLNDPLAQEIVLTSIEVE